MEIEQWLHKVLDSAAPMAISIGSKIVGGIALWIVGRIIISAIRGVVRRASEKRHLDPTLQRYLDSVLGLLLQFLLFIALLGVFGVETASFAGILAAAGVAIGMAWSGLLSNFAAGVFMIVLRPFKVGDMITVCGVTGDVSAHLERRGLPVV